MGNTSSTPTHSSTPATPSRPVAPPKPTSTTSRPIPRSTPVPARAETAPRDKAKLQADIETSQRLLKEAQRLQVASSESKADPTQAFSCYLRAAQLGNQEAWAPLERLGEEMRAAQQTELSNLYRFFKNEPRAVYWEAKAREVTATIRR